MRGKCIMQFIAARLPATTSSAVVRSSSRAVERRKAIRCRRLPFFAPFRAHPFYFRVDKKDSVDLGRLVNGSWYGL